MAHSSGFDAHALYFFC